MSPPISAAIENKAVVEYREAWKGDYLYHSVKKVTSSIYSMVSF